MISDDSLREGMQAPGISFSTAEKVDLAKKISECGISKILISYPPAHKSEAIVASEVTRKGYFKEVFGLGRAIKQDIDLINSTGANISLHFPFKYDSIEEIYSNVKYAVSLGKKVEIAIVDITQYSTGQLMKIVSRLSELGVDTIQLPDTMGKATPKIMERVVRESKKISNSSIEIHCHNDLGLSVANAIAGMEAGADSVDTTFLGLGERNGITDTGVMARYMETTGRHSNLNLDRIDNLSIEFLGIVLKKAGESFFGKNLPNIGRNTYIHTAGTHAAFSDVFEGQDFSVNVYTGKSMLKKILEAKHVNLSKENLSTLMERVKDLSASEGRVIGADEIAREAEELCTE